ncbi:unnamed protein product [Schistosoma margrebowiei]|uniref:Uncharacterized protein n=1 Tax=Schistosoma margrebowiei TaxID=48269 RepID=A0A183N2T4_9TREM|nr:unnamed protein product [Schistosoma margrebowiei]
MWLSEFPKCSQSVRVTKDSSSFGALFSSESNVYDLANSSYDIEYAPSTTVSSVLLYANWDADSNSVRSNFEAVQNMIPYNSHVDVQSFGERGLHNLSENLFKSRNHSTTTCFNPVDITPLNNRRSNLWNNILRKTPVLLLIGPHMSLAEPMDLPLYLAAVVDIILETREHFHMSRLVGDLAAVLVSGAYEVIFKNYLYFQLKLLKLSYFPHDECHTFIVNPAFTNFSLNLTMRDSLKIMNRGAIVTAHKRCKLAAYCPKWWDFVSFHIGISNESICELRERFSEFITDDNSSDPMSDLLRSHKLNSTASRILALLKNQTVAEGKFYIWFSDVIKYAVSLLYEISLYDKQNEMYSSSSLPNDYNWIDSGVIVEQLNFMCCHWYHVDRLVNMHETSGPECQLDPILADASYENLKNSVIYNLGCSLNRTLEFHTLDSHLQPTLAWEIGGYSNDSSWLNSNRWGAAIIDMQNENVFRLEEAVNFQSLSQFIAGFHNSTLRPWLRYPKASQHTSVNSSVSSDLLIVDVKSSVHLTNLIDQSSGLEKSRKNLILLYYSSTCIYSFGGNSALWQFEATARFFKSNQYLLFAR